MTRASGMGSRPKQWVISNDDLLGPSLAAHAQVPERAITSALEDEVLRPVVAELGLRFNCGNDSEPLRVDAHLGVSVDQRRSKAA